MKQWPLQRLDNLFSVEKGRIGIKAATPGRYTLVTTAEKYQTHSEAHFIGDAVCIPMVSATGHGHASIKRLHHVQGEFAVGSILCACVATNAERVSARYVYYYLSACKDTVLIPLMQGSANVSLKLADIAGIEIPLPPLTDQQAIVARFDALADKTRQLSDHLDAIEVDADRLLIALATRSDLTDEERRAQGWIEGRLGDVLESSPDPVTVHADESYPNVGVLSFARGLFTKPPIDGSVTSASTLYRIRAGQFLYSRLFAFEGAYAIVGQEHDGAFVSNEFPTFNIDPTRASLAFLYAYFRSPHVWEQITHGSKGLGDRRQRVQPPQLLNHKLWLPPRSQLDLLEAIVPAVATLKARYTAIRASNAALLPATLERLFATASLVS